LREHRAGCRFRPPFCPFVELAALLLASSHVRLRNPIKSTLAHDAVAAVVLHKHHLIICVGVGLIQFVYGSHSRLAADERRISHYRKKSIFAAIFAGFFNGHNETAESRAQSAHCDPRQAENLQRTNKHERAFVPSECYL